MDLKSGDSISISDTVRYSHTLSPSLNNEAPTLKTLEDKSEFCQTEKNAVQEIQKQLILFQRIKAKNPTQTADPTLPACPHATALAPHQRSGRKARRLMIGNLTLHK